MTDFRPYIEKVNNALEECFPQDDERLTEAMRYSIFAGGKRVRPVLTMLACEFCGKSPERALPFACALEIIHTYSLIYDDMPCMDDDSLRRGRPTNHVVYGEAMALMAGMGLYARAYETVIASDLTDRQKLSGIDILLNASGFNGIVLGQVLDMENNKNTLSEQDVLRIHRLKTSAMLEACVLCGAVAADEYGENPGTPDAWHVTTGTADTDTITLSFSALGTYKVTCEYVLKNANADGAGKPAAAITKTNTFIVTVEEGTLPQARLDESVLRILTLKLERGLLD